MSTDRDGGPAFACAAENGHQPGISLRDYAALKVLSGALASGNYPLGKTGQQSDTEMSEQARALCNSCYSYADAFLKARGKSQ